VGSNGVFAQIGAFDILPPYPTNVTF